MIQIVKKERNYMKRELQVIDQFKGEWEMFSNFHPVVVLYNSYSFPTVEHAFQAAKSTSPFFHRELSELDSSQAGLAKRRGRKVVLRSDWDMVKISVMRKLLMQKFLLNPFKQKLLSTGDAHIIEGNYWHDNYWGDCFCKSCKNLEGSNVLGKLIMKVRNIIQ